MPAEIKVPTLGESVTTATIARWLKQPGEPVSADEPVIELETDKVSVEVAAPSAGVLGPHEVSEGDEVEVGALLTVVTEGGAAAGRTPAPAAAPVPPPAASAPASGIGPAQASRPRPRPRLARPAGFSRRARPAARWRARLPRPRTWSATGMRRCRPHRR